MASSECVFSPGYGRWFSVRPPDSAYPINNTVMKIRAAGSVFTVGTKSVHTSMTDLPMAVSESQDLINDNQKPKHQTDGFTSLENRRVYHLDTSEDLRFKRIHFQNMSIEDKANQNKLTEPNCMEDSGIDCSPVTEDYLIPPPADFAGTLTREDSQEGGFLPIRKSKSAPNPFKKARDNRRDAQKLTSDIRRSTCGKFSKAVHGKSYLSKPTYRYSSVMSSEQRSFCQLQRLDVDSPVACLNICC